MRQTHRSQHTTPRIVIRVIPIEIPLVCVRDPTNLPVTICLPFASQNCVIISGYVEGKATVSSRRLRRIRQMSALWPHDGNWRSRNLRSCAFGTREVRALPHGVFHRQRRPTRQSAIRTGLAGNSPNHRIPSIQPPLYSLFTVSCQSSCIITPGVQLTLEEKEWQT